MARIELVQNEVDMLREILQKHLTELSLEVALTERKDFLEFLGKRKEFVEDLVRRLERELAPRNGIAGAGKKFRSVAEARC